MGFFEYAEKFEVKKSDSPLDKFTETLHNQRKAFSSSEFNRRSWVKEDGEGFLVKLGKLPKVYRCKSREDVTELLDALEVELKQDEELQQAINALYETAPPEPVAKKVGRPKKSSK